jgi:hypothetical protein
MMKNPARKAYPSALNKYVLVSVISMIRSSQSAHRGQYKTLKDNISKIDSLIVNF